MGSWLSTCTFVLLFFINDRSVDFEMVAWPAGAALSPDRWSTRLGRAFLARTCSVRTLLGKPGPGLMLAGQVLGALVGPVLGLDQIPRRPPLEQASSFKTDGPRVGMSSNALNHGMPSVELALSFSGFGHAVVSRSTAQPGENQPAYWYVERELGVWGTERGQNPEKPDTSATMLPIAHSLNKQQVEAVAAYVSSLQ